MAESDFKAGPPQGGQISDSKTTIRSKVEYFGERIFPFVCAGINGYLLYAFCYVVVWRRVRPRNRGASVAILVIFCVLELYATIACTALHAWGPGRVDANYSNKVEPDHDAAFLCDEQGYSLYCSHCKQIKPNRTHHASFTDKCVPVMDHYCPWVGNVIGQGNLKFFLQFCWASLAGTILILITLFIYQHDQVPHINGNSIALYVLAGFLTMFLSIIVVQHTLYIILSQTTLEHMAYRNGNIPSINLLWREGQRRVVRPERKDIIMPKASPFTMGAWQNIKRVFGPLYLWPLPVRGTMSEPQFNEKFLDIMRERVVA